MKNGAAREASLATPVAALGGTPPACATSPRPWGINKRLRRVWDARGQLVMRFEEQDRELAQLIVFAVNSQASGDGPVPPDGGMVAVLRFHDEHRSDIEPTGGA